MAKYLKDTLKTEGEVNYVKSDYIHRRGFDRLHPNTLGTLTYNEATRTLTHTVKSGETEFEFFADGVKFIKTETQTVTHPDTTGSVLFYYNADGVLSYVDKNSVTEDVFTVVAICYVVYYNSITKKAIIQSVDEQHGQLMDASTHWNMHISTGLKYGRNGADAVGFADASDVYESISAAWFFDEDIQLTIPEVTAMPFMYLEGDIALEGGWVETPKDLKIGYIVSGDTYISINTHTGTTYGLTESTSSTDYVIYLILATNDKNNPLKKIVGQDAYANRSQARESLATAIQGVKTIGLPGAEMKFIYAYIAKRNGDLEDDGDGNALIDLRMKYDYNTL